MPREENAFDLEPFYDGACPICSGEIGVLRRLDGEGRICFGDIASPDFDPSQLGATRSRMMAEIHGRLPDGSVIRGVDVFRRAYAAVGFESLIELTLLPCVDHLLQRSYRLFAKHRLRLTGRAAKWTLADDTASP